MIVSAYEGADYVVGVFDDLSLAKIAQETFIKDLSSIEGESPSIIRTNDKKIVEIKNIKIVEYENQYQLVNHIYIASIFNEGFGQIYRHIDSILGSKEAAQKKIKILELKSTENEPTFPEYYSIEKLKINQLNKRSLNQWLENDYFDNDDYLT